MAYPLPFLRLVVSGTLYGVEGFSYGMTFINDNGTGTAPSEVPAGVVTALNTFHTRAGLISNTAKMTTVKLNLIGTDGRYVDQGDTVLYDWATPVGGAASFYPPPQIALAVTLRTGARRGLASRGRFYLPTPGFTVEQGTGQLSETNTTTVLGHVNSLVSALETALPGWDLGVVSQVREGRQRAVEHIEVGRTLDTIRSRRTSIPERYAIGADLVEP